MQSRSNDRLSLFNKKVKMSVYKINASKSFSLRAVGTSNYQDKLEKFAGGRNEESARKSVEVVLIEENDNPHDPNAVKIEIEGEKVGYLSKNNAAHYRSILKGFNRDGAIVFCEGLIVGGWAKEGDYGDFGLRIDFPQIV